MTARSDPRVPMVDAGGGFVGRENFDTGSIQSATPGLEPSGAWVDGIDESVRMSQMSADQVERANPAHIEAKVARTQMNGDELFGIDKDRQV